MDLLVIVLVLAVIGFGVYWITNTIPMSPGWRLAIQVFAFIVVCIFLLRALNVTIPNVMR